MERKKGSLPKSMILIAFGVGLYVILQNLNVVAGAFAYIIGVLHPVILGLCIAFVLNVLMAPCERALGKAFRKIRPPKRLLRGISLLITLMIGLAVIVLTVSVIVPKMAEAVSMFVGNLSNISDQLSSGTLAPLLDILGIQAETLTELEHNVEEIGKEVLAFLKNEGAGIAGVALNVTSSVLGTLTDLIFSIIIAIYVLLDKEKIGRFLQDVLVHFLPERSCSRVVELARLSFSTFSAFVRGQLLEAVILGSLCFVGMKIFNFPYAPVVSLLIGVTALIPIIGAWIGGAVSALLVLLVSPFKALMLIVFILVLQQLEGNLIYPKVVGSTIGLPGVLVLSAVLIGQGLMGVPGILISVPLTAVLYTVLRQAVYSAKKQDIAGVPEDQ